jgi:hypothetical protein
MAALVVTAGAAHLMDEQPAIFFELVSNIKLANLFGGTMATTLLVGVDKMIK